MGDWVGSRADLDILEKVKITAFDRIRFPGHTYHQHHNRFVLYSAFVRHISRVSYLDVMFVLDSDFKAQDIVLFRRFCKAARSDSYLRHVCPFFRPGGTTLLPMEWFS
jgi:hypothetical protein